MQGADLSQYPVDPVADAHKRLLRLEVDIGSPAGDRVGQQGVDQTRFAQAYNSFGVVSKVKRGDQLAHAAKIRGTPSILVDGRYLMLNDNIRSHADLLANTDKVIEKVRAERNLKPKK